MTFLSALYTLFLKPLQLIFEFIYDIAYQIIGNPGLSIIALSLAINLLVLPLYNRADAMQEEERQTEAKLNKWVTHIKKTFKGDERTMMLQTYYRQNNYSPVYVLRSATSLFLEIPFFIAAYRFLSNLELLNGVSFGPIADLSKQDGLIKLFGLSINLLPILMTLINVISSAIFTKDYPLKTKIQLYGMAAFFLVFLYTSPSGLVFYWTLNNLFSLIKTIVIKSKHSKLILCIISLFGGIGILAISAKMFLDGSTKTFILVAVVGLLLFIPFILYFRDKKGKTIHFKLPQLTSNKKIFISCAVFLAVLTGVFIPANVIKASPQEFVDIKFFFHPNLYIVNSLLLSSGIFILWLGVFYWLASPKIKPFFEYSVLALCGVFSVDYLFFGKNLGNMSSNLIFDKAFDFSLIQIGINLLVVLIVLVVFYFAFTKLTKYIPRMIAVVTAAALLVSVVNCISINKSVIQIKNPKSSENTLQIKLSKSGKNVVVLMLDRAMGEYVPYIFNEKPELKEQFSGFVYYDNVISFGPVTNFATPALFGGYEYTPVEINKRKSESLEKKQNEALKVMPKLFNDNGYDVTVFDPPYAGYRWTPDLSVFDDLKGVNKYISNGYFATAGERKNLITNRKRNFFCYSIMKSFPLFLMKTFYSNGKYHNISEKTSGQIIKNESVAQGIHNGFLNSYKTLTNLSDMTKFTKNKNGSFFIMDNETTHEICLLDETDYTPKTNVDNTEFDKKNKSRFTVNGKTLKMEDEIQYAHYESNMAAYIKLGKWFDYLKEQGVYDNTKIILVSDHGRGIKHYDEFIFENLDKDLGDLEYYYPLLMVKDFGATEFKTSSEFMTNADVPTIALNGVIDNPVNPYTGKAINSNEKTKHDQYIIVSDLYDIAVNNGNQFLPSRWYSVHDSIWDRSNWKKVAENAVLTDYKN